MDACRILPTLANVVLQHGKTADVTALRRTKKKRAEARFGQVETAYLNL